VTREMLEREPGPRASRPQCTHPSLPRKRGRVREGGGRDGRGPENEAVSIHVSVSSGGWLAACPDAEALAETAARAALADAPNARAPAVVGVVLTGDAEQRQLNRTYRGKDSPTNVLSFAMTEPGVLGPPGSPVLLGDVVLAFETVAREAGEQDKPLADHLRHLVVHGVLHLLGFDHETDTEAATMEARETAILKGLGVPPPYRDTM
jgi:probable rRNA maturation factor